MTIKNLVLHWQTIALILITGCFALLLARDPFSQRTLIPNLEPYPDTLDYIVPVEALLHGHGFGMYRDGRSFVPTVPPLYSLALAPGLMLHDDPRMFYLVNVGLAFLSFFLFYKLLQAVFRDRMTQAFLLFLYATNFILYWYPSLAMAENLVLPVMIGGVLILVRKPSARSSIIAGILPFALYGIKYANAPLSLAFYAIFAIYFGWGISRRDFSQHSLKAKHLKMFACSAVATVILYSILELALGRGSFFGSIIDVLLTYLHQAAGATSSSPATTSTANAFFSLSFIPRNTLEYGKALLGGRSKLLWQNVSLVPVWIALPSVLGYVFGVLQKKTRTLALAMVGLILAEFAFLSTFYSADIRYFIFVIPFHLLGFGFTLQVVHAFLVKKKRTLIWFILFAALVIVSIATQLVRLKSQVSLNLRYAETPWYYISIVQVNEYLSSHKSEFHSKPVVISSLPPYLIDLYSSQNMVLLPLSPDQEFRSQKKIVWGEYDFNNLLGEYTHQLREGHPVFLMKYGLGNESYLHEAFDQVAATFELQQVSDGCYSLCSIYELTSVKPKK